jgi:hypothetical protein
MNTVRKDDKGKCGGSVDGDKRGRGVGDEGEIVRIDGKGKGRGSK